MAEHRIRLRGGWERLEFARGAEFHFQATLPIAWAPDAEGRTRLIRRFGRPSVDLSEVSIGLEVLDAPGLQALRLNGIELAIDGFPGELPIAGLLAERNTLELEVDLNQALANHSEAGWGSIALVIASGPGG